jgi:uncharacterized protein YfaS (alpha-2-macroglobulin family)
MKKLLRFEPFLRLVNLVRRIAPIAGLAALVTCLLWERTGHGQDAPPEAKDPSGIVVASEEPGAGNLFTITFPSTMVETDKIGKPTPSAPVQISPTLAGTYTWRTQTELDFVPGALPPPGQTYALSLASGSRDLAGKDLPSATWTHSLTMPALEIQYSNLTGGYDGNNQNSSDEVFIGIRPQIQIGLTSPVDPALLAQATYLQDENGVHYPVDVILDNSHGGGATRDFTITPRADLPVGRHFNLAAGNLPPKPLGQTAPLKVAWVGGFNLPLRSPQIIAHFDQTVNPDSITKDQIQIEPEVPNLRVSSQDWDIRLDGDFDITKRYRVTMGTGLRSANGYGLASPSTWGATFHPKGTAIIFPGDDFNNSGECTDMSNLIFARAATGLNFSFYQVNTGALTWKLASIPLNLLGTVSQRLREYNMLIYDKDYKPVPDPVTGRPEHKKTSLFISEFQLPVVATGQVDALQGEKEALRTITQPLDPNVARQGPFLLEISGSTPDGGTIANRSILTFSDIAIVRKYSNDGIALKLLNISDGSGISGASLKVISYKNVELASGISDQSGSVHLPFGSLVNRFDKNDQLSERLAVVTVPGGVAMQYLPLPKHTSQLPDSSQPPAPALQSFVVSDRPVYQPGETVSLHGFIREGSAVPINKTAKVSLQTGTTSAELVSTNIQISDQGGWSATWPMPAEVPPGPVSVVVSLDGQDVTSGSLFQIQSFQPPLFSVEVKAFGKDNLAVAQLRSVYFHGAPNANAHFKWHATWETLDPPNPYDSDPLTAVFEDYSLWDQASDASPPSQEAISTEGEGTLGPDGTAVLTSTSPFKGAEIPWRAKVYWKVEVTSIEGRVFVGGDTAIVQRTPTLLGAALSSDDQGQLMLRLTAFNSANEQVPGVDCQAKVYKVTDKTVVEQVSDHVLRYVNRPILTEVFSISTKTPYSGRFIPHFPDAQARDLPTLLPGEYRVVASEADPSASLPVSTSTDLAGPGYAEFKTNDNVSVTLKPDKKEYAPGDTAHIALESPIDGNALVTVETDQILDSYDLKLVGNAAQVDVPIKAGYKPNVFVTVYLFKPAGNTGLPVERLGTAELSVRDPHLDLVVTPTIERTRYEPGETVAGAITVNEGDKPAPGVETTVYAVNEAVLQMGGWQPPDMGNYFYPRRSHGVETYLALERFVDSIRPESLIQKGFVVGGGGPEIAYNTYLRKDFQPLAYPMTTTTTDASGQVKFSFRAPDNLSTFRVVALAQTAANQFGTGSLTFETNKKLMVQPVLPKFARTGDHLELRTSVRQNSADSENITVHCTPGPGFVLEDPDTLAKPVTRDTPVIFIFRGHLDGEKPITVQFAAKTESGSTDSIEQRIAVLPPNVEHTESVDGKVVDAGGFAPAQALPPKWQTARGDLDLFLSSSPWLARLEGFSEMLQYSHDDLEQLSSNIRAYLALSDVLANLPDANRHRLGYFHGAQQALQTLDASLLADADKVAFLPTWPGKNQRDAFVTAEAFWAVQAAEKEKSLKVSPRLDQLEAGTAAIARGQASGATGVDPFNRCFALMVLSEQSPSPETDLPAIAQSLYLSRDQLSSEGRAVLALALANLNIMPSETEQLLQEIEPSPGTDSFDRVRFSSAARATAMRLLAKAHIHGANWSEAERSEVLADLKKLLGATLSSQETLWALLAFNEVQKAESYSPPKAALLDPKPEQVSPNRLAVAWYGVPIDETGKQFPKPLRTGVETYYMMRGHYHVTADEVPLVNDLGVSRAVKDLTDPSRLGTAQAPLQLGDEVLVTYTVTSTRPQNFVEIEDELPACLESVNPELALIRQFYPAANTSGDTLTPSASERRDSSTSVYFDSLPAGTGTCSVLCRVTVAGEFQWPATQVSPLYDKSISGASTSSRLTVKAP